MSGRDPRWGTPGRGELTGLRDAHLHLYEHGEELSCVQLADCTSAAQCLERIAREADERAKEPAPGALWLKAVGARPDAWQQPRWPTARELHDAARGLPCLMFGFDHHAMVASLGALRAVGITRDTPDPAHGSGRIERFGRDRAAPAGGHADERDGEPTGLLIEAAFVAVRRAAPEPSEAERRVILQRAIADLAAQGFVEVHDMFSLPWLARTLGELEREGRLPLRVVLHPPPEWLGPMHEERAAWQSERVTLGGMKLFADGTLGSRTAWMLDAYRDRPGATQPDGTHGMALLRGSALDEHVRRADALGCPVVVHAIGDGAVREVLDSLERVQPRARGQRIEHAQFVHERDVPRFARLGVVASVQPCHLLTDIEAIRAAVPDRAERSFPLRDLVDASRRAGRDECDLVWLGSDTPIVPPDPRDNLQAAVERRRAGMGEAERVGGSQAIDAALALNLMSAPR